MGNPFHKLVRRESKALVKSGPRGLVKLASRAGYKIEPSVINVGLADVVTHEANAVNVLPARVLRMVGHTPPVPGRAAVLMEKVKKLMVPGAAGIAAVEVMWDCWHESGWATKEREAIDQWLNQHGVRAGDPLSALTPEELAELATLIARIRGGEASKEDIDAFVDVITHTGLKEAVQGHGTAGTRRSLARPVATTGVRAVGSGSTPLAAPAPGSREVIEWLCSAKGVTPDQLRDEFIRHSLLMKLSLTDFDRYTSRRAPSSGRELLHALEAADDGEGADDGEESDAL
jgi:hypothetical protein